MNVLWLYTLPPASDRVAPPLCWGPGEGDRERLGSGAPGLAGDEGLPLLLLTPAGED